MQRAVVYGDQTKPGIYVVRINFRPGVMSKPHLHKEDRHALVIQGTWYTGTGNVWTPDKTMGLKPGSYMLHPGGENHFDGAKDEEVILQLVGYGPSSTTYVKPEDGEFGRIKWRVIIVGLPRHRGAPASRPRAPASSRSCNDPLLKVTTAKPLSGPVVREVAVTPLADVVSSVRSTIIGSPASGRHRSRRARR